VRLNLKIWRQTGPNAAGRMEDYVADHVSPDMSFLEMLDVVNEGLVKSGKDAIAFDSDCREGICGMCSLVVNGIPHGPDRGTTVCQLHMRRFKDGDTITVEPWRAKAFPVIKDLVVDRSASDRIIAAGGYNSVNVGGAKECGRRSRQRSQSDRETGSRRQHHRRLAREAPRWKRGGDQVHVELGRQPGDEQESEAGKRDVRLFQKRKGGDGHGVGSPGRRQCRSVAADGEKF
jgi:hypothetical protein